MDKTGKRIILPGAERSARQAVAARGAKLRARKLQLPPGGLFEAPEPEEPALLCGHGKVLGIKAKQED
jgi:hypothetical protein